MTLRKRGGTGTRNTKHSVGNSFWKAMDLSQDRWRNDECMGYITAKGSQQQQCKERNIDRQTNKKQTSYFLMYIRRRTSDQFPSGVHSQLVPSFLEVINTVLSVGSAHTNSILSVSPCVKMRLWVELPDICRSNPDGGIPRRYKDAFTWLLPPNHAPSLTSTDLKSSHLSLNPVPCSGHH
jgi:hypothetical protein